MNPPPFFIVGCWRSGTTLLRDLLRAHPRLTIPNETRFIPRLARLWPGELTPDQAQALGRCLIWHPAVRAWDITLQPRDFRSCGSFPEAIRVLFGAWADRDRRPRWGDKTPEYVTEIDLLAGLFPDAQFIHCVRDGRDVALSWRRKWDPRASPIALAGRWKALVEAGRRSGARLGEKRYTECRFEDLVLSPETELRRLLAFLSEEYSPAVLSRRRLEDRMERTTEGLVNLEAVPTNREKWKTRMTPADIRGFEGVAGDLLADLGYEVSAGPRAGLPPQQPEEGSPRRLMLDIASAVNPRRDFFAQRTIIWWAGVYLTRAVRSRSAPRGGGGSL